MNAMTTAAARGMLLIYRAITSPGIRYRVLLYFITLELQLLAASFWPLVNRESLEVVIFVAIKFRSRSPHFAI
jgi:hypothetical protein